MSVSNLDKLKYVNLILDMGDTIFVHLNSHLAEALPKHLVKQGYVVLQIGHHMPVPIKDLIIDGLGICGILSFQGKPSYIDVPWKAIIALVQEDGKGMIFDDVPENAELLRSNLEKQDQEAMIDDSPNVIRFDPSARQNRKNKQFAKTVERPYSKPSERKHLTLVRSEPKVKT